jgi:hypothetical protein
MTPTSPDYSGTPQPSPPKEATPNPHAALSWTACYDDGCNTHIGEKQGAGWYPKKPRRPRRSHTEIYDWEHCVNDQCRRGNHWGKKLEAGYYPRKSGEKAPLSEYDQQCRLRQQEAVRTRKEKEEGEKEETATEPDVDELQRGITGLHQIIEGLHEVVNFKSITIANLEQMLRDQRQALAIAAQEMERMRKRAHAAERNEREQKRRMKAIARDLDRLAK